MMYTHNWALFFATACGGAWLLLLWRAPASERRELLRAGLLAFGGALVLYLPWVPTTLYQAAHTGAPWSDAPDLGALSDVPAQLLGRMPQIVLLICAGAGVLALLSTRGVQQRFAERGRAVLCLAVLAAGTILLAWVASRVSPAWANRYLAVALPPFVLLAAGGLAFAGRLGLVGLVLVVVMWAQDAAPVEKSNVRAIAQAVAPSLQPGDLVVTTQPETVAVLHYYLPPGLRYATLTGPLSEVGVWDWRDGVQRLQATTPQRDLQPLLDGLPPGRRIALFSPITSTLNRWQAPWTKLVRLRSEEWAQYLSDDPRFQVTASLPENFESPRPNPVQATVLMKTRR
jgi:mannosyltransferase